ncbi:methyltransferase [Paludicola sp. MB14-C6]|uniref:tRNA1(Val) (adenine(37)-N6)-methyltransferase n=1 Tax=Paludihabitans sp. MB14-C6 TaxID=3070656 RepID=UPI0027DD4B96|nr:methyltransferase [Paludicola sp. MB14-C6]WMJ22294.1 methyltransferase [Paludicola sp. MB14-C6]
MNENYSFEKLSETIQVCVSKEHRFGTDAFLLSVFANPRKKDIVCDLGTGCGIIPMILTKKFEPKKIYGVDIQPQAIEQFHLSIENSSLPNEVEPILCDLTKLNTQIPYGSCDVVTCNPPYKANQAGILSELTAEQIARHEVMCTIDDICKTASKLLKFGGKLCLCQRPERLADVITAMKQNDIEPKLLRFIAKEHTQAPWLFLIEGKKGSKPFMKVMPTMQMYDGEEFSKELKQVYGNDYSNGD